MGLYDLIRYAIHDVSINGEKVCYFVFSMGHP